MATIQRPYGNSFLVETPALDQLSNRLYQEEQRRNQLRYQENKQLDEEFSRNLAGIRDSDIGDLTKSYGDYKLAYQQLMKKKGGGTPQEQLEILRKKADVYDIINKSKQDKTWEDAQAKQIMTDKKGIYADDAHQQLLQRRGTPLSQLNRDNDQNLLYKYSVPDLDKELKTARGTDKEVRIPIGVDEKDPLKDKIEVYKVGNSPNQYFSSLLNDVVSKNQGRNFAGLINNKYSDQELEDLTNRYEAKITDPKFVAIHGETKPFPPSALQTDLGKAVAIQTMEEAVNYPLTPKVISEVNVERQTKDRQKFAIEQQARAAKNSLARLYVYANIQDRKPESVEKDINGLITNHIEEGRNNNGEVLVDNETYKSITGQDKTGRSFLKVDEAGNYTYGKKVTDDNGVVTEQVSGNIPLDAAKIKLTKTYKGGLDTRFNKGKVEIPKGGTYIIKGKKYSESELIKMGYTLDQIKPYKQ